ncbi:MAG: class I SAM-dependent methyltransferase [Caulobacteraceae bacterium]|nr:class I SAM-dependent methyltransferase [Caulobacteraceae bacterium]
MTVPMPSPTLWNTRGGSAWVDLQPMLDAMFQPFEALLAEAIPEGARRVLDVGCGAGATTLALAKRLGDGGTCTGLDVSEALVDLARRRAEAEGVAGARFVVGDGQRHDFGDARFDAVVSRFGVMFFDDPETAFARLRAATGDGAAMTLIVWRGPEDNPFMTAAERAAAPLLPELKPIDTDGPGQFGFADPERVRSLLRPSWGEVEIQPLDVDCTITAADLETYAVRMGRVAHLLPDLEPERRDAVIAAVRDGFAPFVTGDTTGFTAACWIVRGTASQ